MLIIWTQRCTGKDNIAFTFTLLHRPNLCRTKKVYKTKTYSYAYQRRCWFGRFCSLKCKSTGSCDGNLVNVTKTEVDCCEGFAEDPSLSSSGGYFGGRSRRSGYSYGSKSLRRNGCPISKLLLDWLYNNTLLCFCLHGQR